ncbi:SDR family NAD(P)-dependent oxidoreductase [Brevibacillus fulvus]|uniref:3-oxoacyl-[acyl-carrier protein] reductase n=1 Tax=Brevibacillus fulvus TaxID=1125967 RepID=A0A938Y4A7_9BACL|nr:SDR family NAD(P)-dependent oxidoreductase [Brevibacillus fulvus]MBM7591696.1 3-oxoacyl-[acyl-carrier protein] reductase [Brevibacillus fulvus]
MQLELFPLANKVALVTNGFGPVGEEICRRLAGAGANVWLHGQVEEGCELSDTMAAEWTALGVHLSPVRGTAADRQTIAQLVATILEQCGKIDLLVNNCQAGQRRSFHQLTPADWLTTMQLNLDRPFLFCQQVLPAMLGAGGGTIVHVSSTAALTGQISPDFAASQSAVQSLTKGLWHEFHGKGIQVIGLAPEAKEAGAEQSGQLAKAIGEMVLLLGTGYGVYLNGEILTVHGGIPNG